MLKETNFAKDPVIIGIQFLFTIFYNLDIKKITSLILKDFHKERAILFHEEIAYMIGRFLYKIL